MSANKIKRMTYLTSKRAQRGQENRISDSAVKMTRIKRHQLGIEKITLKGFNANTWRTVYARMINERILNSLIKEFHMKVV